MDLDLANVKPSIQSWVVVTLMSVTGIVLGKYFFTKVLNVPGLSALFASA
jgi:hypothetical protein